MIGYGVIAALIHRRRDGVRAARPILQSAVILRFDHPFRGWFGGLVCQWYNVADLVSAPVGYGKTTLLSETQSSGRAKKEKIGELVKTISTNSPTDLLG